MTKNIIAVICLLMLGACVSIDKKPIIGQQIAYQKHGETYQYLRYIPKGYSDDKNDKTPVLIFLHGSGERGDNFADIDRVKVHGPPKLVANGRDLPFIVISPQLENGQMWINKRLDATLKSALAGLNYDSSRIYLTGLSRGGGGTWNWAIENHNFAAIAPVAGWSNAGFACNLKDTPVWVFHGMKDDVVSPIHSKDMEKQIMGCGGDVKATYYPDANHDSWTQTYDNQELYDWFLTKKLKAK